jgi:hypothetical protein
MENILKKGSKVVVFKLCCGIPPSIDHEHQIDIIPGSTSPNKMPYIYPHRKKWEIKKTIQDMLDLAIIQPRRSSFSA